MHHGVIDLNHLAIDIHGMRHLDVALKCLDQVLGQIGLAAATGTVKVDGLAGVERAAQRGQHGRVDHQITHGLLQARGAHGHQMLALFAHPRHILGQGDWRRADIIAFFIRQPRQPLAGIGQGITDIALQIATARHLQQPQFAHVRQQAIHCRHGEPQVLRDLDQLELAQARKVA